MSWTWVSPPWCIRFTIGEVDEGGVVTWVKYDEGTARPGDSISSAEAAAEPVLLEFDVVVPPAGRLPVVCVVVVGEYGNGD